MTSVIVALLHSLRHPSDHATRCTWRSFSSARRFFSESIWGSVLDNLKWEHVVTDLSVPAKPAGLWTLAVPYVPRSSIVKIVATGTWMYAPGGTCGPDGARTPVGAVTSANCLYPQALVGSLIAKIGGGSCDTAGTIAGVGHHGVLVVPDDTAGALFVTVNDEISGMDDNSGALAVQVFVASAPAATS